MSIKTKTMTAAALAALAVPAAALADGSERSAEAHKKNSERKAQKTTPKTRAFVVQGVGVTGVLPVADKKLNGALTLDPTSANKHARKVLDTDGLTKAELKSTKTVTFGETGDAVLVRYVGLPADSALQATDRVKVIGKVARSGDKSTINIRKITVKRETEENQSEAATTEQKSGERS